MDVVDIRYLLDEVERLKAENDGLRAAADSLYADNMTLLDGD